MRVDGTHGNAWQALVLYGNVLFAGTWEAGSRRVLESYAASSSFFIPKMAYAEAEEHLSVLVVERGGSTVSIDNSLQGSAGKRGARSI